MSVATGTSMSSAASAGASVRMSATTTSGRSSLSTGTAARAACTTASYGFIGRDSVGNTWYSGAGQKRRPSPSIASRQRFQVCTVTS